MEYPEIIIDTNVFIEHQRKQNKQFEIRDILIAGIVIKHQLPLATLNSKHFADFIDNLRLRHHSELVSKTKSNLC